VTGVMERDYATAVSPEMVPVRLNDWVSPFCPPACELSRSRDLYAQALLGSLSPGRFSRLHFYEDGTSAASP